MRRTLLLALFLLALAPAVSAQSQTIRITRVEMSAPWSGFYYQGQGQQLWSKAVVLNSSATPLKGATLRFEFFDPIGTRETFDTPLPTIPPGGVTSIDSPQWWDYSGAQIGCKALIFNQNGDALATGQTGR
ncbi:MAG: hypothetical protein KC800_17905 [Candidatus Eremiobacteraeota bacterium]|nr:hypothetical protein [Candidatus Eremiobacteraeota bacterium]